MAFFKIVTDTTADLPADFLKTEEIETFSLTYSDGKEEYGNVKELDGHSFYESMRNGAVYNTSQVNPSEARKNFDKLLEKETDILYVAFSSGLSGTYNSVRLAATEIAEERGNVNIYVVDSLCASLGEGLLVYYACILRREGLSVKEVYDRLMKHRHNIVHLFTVEDLIYLHRGGRVSKGTAVLGNVLNIKPLLHVDNEGHLVPIGNVRGRRKSLMALVDNMAAKIGSYEGKNKIFFISHGDCPEDAEFVKQEVIKRFGINDNIVNTIGPTIGSHSGPGTVALFFFGDER